MLNGFQQKVARIAILCVSICAIGGFAIAVFKILGAFLDKFGAVIWPLALAVILSFILKPAVDFMADRLRVGRTAACWIMMAFLVVFQHMILKVSSLHGRPMVHMPVLFFTELVDLVLQMFVA